MTTDFGKILQKLMIDEDITQKSLAKDLGISPSILSNYITGKNIPEMELAGKIIKRFKLKKNEIKKLFNGGL